MLCHALPCCAVNDQNSWGINTRVGYSGDIDTSDSADTVIGLGLACFNNCAGHAATGPIHGSGSGYYQYQTHSTAPHDGALQGWLWVRSLASSNGAANTEATALAKCSDVKGSAQWTGEGVYWITGGGNTAFKARCDADGYTLVMSLSSSSQYLYGNAVWTASSAYGNHPLDTAQDIDAVSPAFYSATGTQSKLCMKDMQHCAAWSHGAGTPRALANGAKPASSASAFPLCHTAVCGVNTRPASIFGATSGTSAAYWARWGYGESRAVGSVCALCLRVLVV